MAAANGKVRADGTERIGPGAFVLRSFVDNDEELLRAIASVAGRAPFRRMITPGGRPMSVEMTNCGDAGWVSDREGYRYTPTDPSSGRAWPSMPAAFAALADAASVAAGFGAFSPDACLINRYVPGTRLSLHQDRDEQDFGAPIVSVSLGLPATFLFGGARRTTRARRHRLEHGDVVVWGGESRLHFHGVAPLAEGSHPKLGARRLNLTLRKAR